MVEDDTVRNLMHEMGLWPVQPRPWRPVINDADLDHRIPELVGRDFTEVGPGRKFVSEITHNPPVEGWLYLATVIDCGTKMAAGRSMTDHYRTTLIEAALDMMAGRVSIVEDAFFHSDRGSSYTSYDFGKKPA
jgi:transposase InsO family protein